MLESQQKPENKDLNLPSFSDDDDDDTDLLDEKSRPGRKSRRRGWIIGISVVLLIIILVGSVPFIIRSLRPPRVVYQFQQVTQGNLSLTVTATGPVQGTTYNADF